MKEIQNKTNSLVKIDELHSSNFEINSELSKNRDKEIQAVESEELQDEILDREVETMIECTEFIGSLMNINKKQDSNRNVQDKKFQHVFQSDEISHERINIDQKLLHKKRRKINIQIDESCDNSVDYESIFESVWQK